MYSYITGELVSRGSESIVLDHGGIGYEIFVPPAIAGRLGSPGDHIRVYTFLHVREDAFQLFGFSDKEQQTLFNTLLSVSGIGPKLAMSILDTLTPDRFALAILNEDLKTLTTVKGLGKKGAARVVLELKDKMAKTYSAEMIEVNPDDSQSLTEDQSTMRHDVLSALLVLGYSSAEASSLIEASFDPDQSLEENISLALRRTLT
ncbi:MAG: Holliday junction branch migration protein RuvA [Fastidiosipilaceae bacterium]|jgi:Holliday junction DNA helicase RuvA|nr:Holliday junction branch migration protein RuvA [Clostridiaceae bacterium]